MRKSTKLLVCAALALPVIVAVAPTQEASAQSFVPTQTIYKVNNSLVALDFNTFTSALNAKVLTDLNIQYIQLSNGKYYSFTIFTSALNAHNNSLEKATTTLNSNPTYAESLTNVVNGQVNVATGTVKAPTTSTAFEVISIE